MTPDALADELRTRLAAEYAPPDEPRYWDGLEGRILAAVRDGAMRAATTTTGAFRAVPAAAVEWWDALAGWARPGFAAAALAIGVALFALVRAHTTETAARANRAFRDVLGAPDVSVLSDGRRGDVVIVAARPGRGSPGVTGGEEP